MDECTCFTSRFVLPKIQDTQSAAAGFSAGPHDQQQVAATAAYGCRAKKTSSLEINWYDLRPKEILVIGPQNTGV